MVEQDASLTIPQVRDVLRSWLESHDRAVVLYGDMPRPPMLDEAGSVLRFLIDCTNATLNDPGLVFVNDDPAFPLGRWVHPSLSHAPLRVGAKTDTEEPGVADGGEIEERLEAMETKLERLEALTRELVALLESPRRSSAL